MVRFMSNQEQGDVTNMGPPGAAQGQWVHRGPLSGQTSTPQGWRLKSSMEVPSSSSQEGIRPGSCTPEAENGNGKPSLSFVFRLATVLWKFFP